MNLKMLKGTAQNRIFLKKVKQMLTPNIKGEFSDVNIDCKKRITHTQMWNLVCDRDGSPNPLEKNQWVNDPGAMVNSKEGLWIKACPYTIHS